MSRIARSYAKAALAAAKTTEAAVVVRDDLRRFAASVAAAPAFARMAANPAVPLEVKEKVLAEIAGKLALGPVSRQLLGVLLRNFRMAHLDAVLATLEELLNRRLGVAIAHVTTAEPLDDTRQNALLATLGKLTGRRVELTTTVDASLLAGFVARVDSTLYDASLRGQLRRLAGRLAAA